jgi:type I restriction enzyme M protein
MNEQALVAKVWNYAHVLRDDGVSYGDYLGQISFLLFLKMEKERTDLLGDASALPADANWDALAGQAGEALERTYRRILDTLSRRGDIVGTLFLKAENKIGDPAKLQRLVTLIGAETWMGLNVDVKGAIYEGLLERNAGEVKSGAGQYFTPRPLIEVITQVVDPEPDDTVHDPAVGTGGFLLAAYEHMKPKAPDKKAALALRQEKLSGTDIVAEVVRLCAMNLYLHGIGGAHSPVRQKDALLDRGDAAYDVILTNPPFGKRQSFRIVREDGGIDSERQNYVRDDFTVTTGNKQLNFLQHIMSILKVGGSAAVVMPDNVLFEGGAGETLRRRLLEEFDFHTLLRLPTGIFYSQGVKANVLFFDRAAPGGGAATRDLWVYDLRTNQRFTLRERPLKRADLDDFVACYGTKHRRRDRRESERFRHYGYEALVARDKLNLDLFWLKDAGATDPDTLPPPAEIAAEIVDSLEAALEKFRLVAAKLGAPPAG